MIIYVAKIVPRLRFIKEIFVDFRLFLVGKSVPPNICVGMELLNIVAIKTDDGLPIVSAEVSPPIFNDVIVLCHSLFLVSSKLPQVAHLLLREMDFVVPCHFLDGIAESIKSVTACILVEVIQYSDGVLSFCHIVMLFDYNIGYNKNHTKPFGMVWKFVVFFC